MSYLRCDLVLVLLTKVPHGISGGGDAANTRVLVNGGLHCVGACCGEEQNTTSRHAQD